MLLRCYWWGGSQQGSIGTVEPPSAPTDYRIEDAVEGDYGERVIKSTMAVKCGITKVCQLSEAAKANMDAAAGVRRRRRADAAAGVPATQL